MVVLYHLVFVLHHCGTFVIFLGLLKIALYHFMVAMSLSSPLTLSNDTFARLCTHCVDYLHYCVLFVTF